MAIYVWRLWASYSSDGSVLSLGRHRKHFFSLGSDTMYMRDGVSRIIVVGRCSRGDPPCPVRLLVGIEL